MSGLEVLLGLGITANAMWIIQNAKIAIFGKNGCKWCKKVTDTKTDAGMLFIIYSITVVFKIQVLRVLIKNLNLSLNHILPIPYGCK